MTDDTTASSKTKHTAGAFDIRTFIAALMGIYGIVLLLTGIFGGVDTTTGKAEGNPNLWVGIALLAFAAAMQTWAMVKPTVVDEAALARQKAEQDQDGPPAH